MGFLAMIWVGIGLYNDWLIPTAKSFYSSSHIGRRLALTRSLAWTLGAITLTVANFAFADEFKSPNQPLWEGGLIAGTGFAPDYPAADQGRIHYLVFPMLIYRGNYIRNDDKEGLRARLSEIKSRLGFDLSASGSFPTDSKHNDARRGMRDLDWLFEIGPRLFYRLVDEPQFRLQLGLATRAVLSSDTVKTTDRGLHFSPSIRMERSDLFGSELHAFAQWSCGFGTARLNKYFYSVEPVDALPNRPVYSAKAGFIGTSLAVGIKLPLTRQWRALSGTGLNWHSGSANQESPLFRRELNAFWFVSLSWLFHQSDTPGFD